MTIFASYLIALLIRFFSTPYGILLGSPLLYFGMSSTGSGVLTPEQLAVWFYDLDTSTKTAVLSSLITVIGFLYAFHTASVNWKEQALTNLKLGAASELGEFYTNASRMLTDAKIYARTLVDTAEKLTQHVGTADQNRSDIGWALSRLPAFLETRDQLSAMNTTVHHLLDKHSSAIGTVIGVGQLLDDSAQVFNEMIEEIWFPLPALHQNRADSAQAFVAQLNIQKCRQFIERVDENFLRMSALSGMARGALVAPVVGLRWATLWFLTGDVRNVKYAIANTR